VGSCEHANETSSSLKYGESIDQPSDYRILKKYFALWCLLGSFHFSPTEQVGKAERDIAVPRSTLQYVTASLDCVSLNVFLTTSSFHIFIHSAFTVTDSNNRKIY